MLNSAMDRIRRKTECRERLSETDAIWLMDEAPLLFLGETCESRPLSPAP